MDAFPHARVDHFVEALAELGPEMIERRVGRTVRDHSDARSVTEERDQDLGHSAADFIVRRGVLRKCRRRQQRLPAWIRRNAHAIRVADRADRSPDVVGVLGFVARDCRVGSCDVQEREEPRVLENAQTLGDGNLSGDRVPEDHGRRRPPLRDLGLVRRAGDTVEGTKIPHFLDVSRVYVAIDCGRRRDTELGSTPHHPRRHVAPSGQRRRRECWRRGDPDARIARAGRRVGKLRRRGTVRRTRRENVGRDFFADIDAGVGGRQASCRQGSHVQRVERRALGWYQTDQGEVRCCDRGRVNRCTRRRRNVDARMSLGVLAEGGHGIVNSRFDDGRQA